jgi:hypothetical protein
MRRINRRTSLRAPTSRTRLRGAGATRVNAIDLIIRGGLFMNRHRSLGPYLKDEATAEPSPGSAPTFSIPGLTILGSPRTFGFSFKLFDRPNRR